MAKPENWIHYTSNILGAARLIHMEPEVPDGSNLEPEDLKKQIEAADPYEDRLKPITKDQKVKGGLPAWNVRLCGETSTFASVNPAQGKQNYGVVVVRSLQWPGSYSFFTQSRWL
jgi:radial spoke head protein 4A